MPASVHTCVPSCVHDVPASVCTCACLCAHVCTCPCACVCLPVYTRVCSFMHKAILKQLRQPSCQGPGGFLLEGLSHPPASVHTHRSHVFLQKVYENFWNFRNLGGCLLL